MLSVLGPRTLSLARDLKLARTHSAAPTRLLAMLAKWNDGHKWWAAHRRARDALPAAWCAGKETQRLMPTDDQFVAWAAHGRVREVCAALMFEAATLADVCAAVYTHAAKVVVELQPDEGAPRAAAPRFVGVTVSLSTPARCVAALDPAARPLRAPVA
jgi:hypothetical protein